MPKLSLAVRVAAISLLSLSCLHVLFWAIMAAAARSSPETYPNTLFILVSLLFSVIGSGGVFVGIGLLRAHSWARIAALVLAALAAVFSAMGALALLLVFVGNAGALFGIEVEVHQDSRVYFIALGILYFSIFCLALWWIYVFSRSSVAAQFSQSQPAFLESVPRKAKCPPPIALLAWLMIISGLLSAVSWPLILGKIPAMLFTHIFSPTSSKWIWIANIALFLACGLGLLRLQRWSYPGAITLHAFWMVSVFVTQLSADYDAYLRRCIETLSLGDAYPVLSRVHLSPWLSAITTAIPTALLIAGLFYYRRAFLQAVNDSRHLSS
jgi:hypothetical protein